MTPDRSHRDTVGRVANKVRVEGVEAPCNPYFYVPKYRSSDVLPAPEIFFNIRRHYFYKLIKFLKNLMEFLLKLASLYKKLQNMVSSSPSAVVDHRLEIFVYG